MGAKALGWLLFAAIGVATPSASAYDLDEVLSVPEKTLDAVDLAVASQENGLAVTNATSIVLDLTQPSVGALTAPDYSNNASLAIAYDGVADAGGSGLEDVTLWYRQGDGAWQATTETNTGTSGSLAFSAFVDEGPYAFALQVSDRAGNASPDPTGAGDATTVYDVTPPTLSLNGDASMLVVMGQGFSDPGASAVDNIEGNISGSVTVTGAVNADAPGDYTLTYKVADAAGNFASSLQRHVTVMSESTGNATYLWGEANGDGEVSNGDSRTVLRYLTGKLKTLGVDPTTGVDVNGDGTIGTLDSSLIKQYSRNKIGQFPADTDGDGLGPESSAGLTAGMRDQGPARRLTIAGQVHTGPGAEFDVPISVDNVAGILGYSLVVAFDDRDVDFVNLTLADLHGDWEDPDVHATQNRVAIAGSGADPLNGSGTLLVLTFRAHADLNKQVVKFRLENVELNDDYIGSSVDSETGAPELTGLAPEQGASSGGVVVTLEGANLATVDTVLFGNTPAEWVRVRGRKANVQAVAPAGFGTVDVTVISPYGEDSLPGAFSYFRPDVQLSLASDSEATSGETLRFPVQMTTPGGVRPARVRFKLRFDPTLFAPRSSKHGAGIATLGEASKASGKSVVAESTAPGEVTVAIGDGPADSAVAMSEGNLVDIELVAIGNTDGAETLVYLSEIEADDAKSVSLKAAGSALVAAP
jgi:hypothetical protein